MVSDQTTVGLWLPLDERRGSRHVLPEFFARRSQTALRSLLSAMRTIDDIQR
jgi:hypothetical protein